MLYILIIMYYYYYHHYYIMFSFVSRSILNVMYIPLSVFCLTVLFCVLFTCKCVLCCCHRDIGAISYYLNLRFSVLFP
jgi:hypothetical protein